MARSVRAQVLVAAGARLRKVADEALSLASTLETVETRVAIARAAFGPLDGGRHVERTRAVLERDRALRASSATAGATSAPKSAAPNAQASPPPPPPPVQLTAIVEGVQCDEPIRTRSMAKLLAAQGHPDRALAILRYLLARSPDDAALQAEISALQAAQSVG
jgi:hypothetical protein